MTADEYKTALAGLGLTHAKAADLFGYTRQASYLWAKGRNRIPQTAELHIHIARALGVETFARLKAEAQGGDSD